MEGPVSLVVVYYDPCSPKVTMYLVKPGLMTEDRKAILMNAQIKNLRYNQYAEMLFRRYPPQNVYYRDEWVGEDASIARECNSVKFDEADFIEDPMRNLEGLALLRMSKPEHVFVFETWPKGETV